MALFEGLSGQVWPLDVFPDVRISWTFDRRLKGRNVWSRTWSASISPHHREQLKSKLNVSMRKSIDDHFINRRFINRRFINKKLKQMSHQTFCRHSPEFKKVGLLGVGLGGCHGMRPDFGREVIRLG